MFAINGEKHVLHVDPGLSLSAYLAQHTRFNIKIGCGEGGCGCCAVLVSHLRSGLVHTESVNSCLKPVGTLDGCAVTTSEGLGNSSKGFSVVQDRFAEFSASQCGFCTPGFVVACHAALLSCKGKGVEPTPELLQKGLDGNLCRCTGYRPITDVCKSLASADMEDLGLHSCTSPGPCKEASDGPEFPAFLRQYVESKAKRAQAGMAGCGVGDESERIWLVPSTLKELLQALQSNDGTPGGCAMVAGNTSAGLWEHEWPPQHVLVDTRHVKELTEITKTEDEAVLGGACSISQLIDVLREDPKLQAWQVISDHLLRIAGSHIRNAATLGGHVVLVRERALQSDVSTPLMAAGASVKVVSQGGSRQLSLEAFLHGPDGGVRKGEVVCSIHVPVPQQHDYFWSHKVSQRFWNSHALVNMSLMLRLEEPTRRRGSRLASALGFGDRQQPRRVASARLVVGAPVQQPEGKDDWINQRLPHVEALFKDTVVDLALVTRALRQLDKDFQPAAIPGVSADYAKHTAQGLLFAALAPVAKQGVAGDNARLQQMLDVQLDGEPSVPTARQELPDFSKLAPPVCEPVQKDRARLQASGQAMYTSDVHKSARDLFAAPVESQRALAKLGRVNAEPALKLEGVVAYIDGKDVPEGGSLMAAGERYFAEGMVEFHGQVIGLVVATSQRLAERAAWLVEVEYLDDSSLGTPILSIADAIKAESFYGAHPEPVMSGNAAKALAEAKNVIRGARYCLPSQQHFFMETQSCVVLPDEAGTVQVTSSCQSIDAVQDVVAAALNLPYNKVLVATRRVGGGFGGKATRPMPYAAMCAVAANKLQQQVRLTLNRNTDLRLNGGRSETEVEYSVGFDDSGHISALEVKSWCLAGWFKDIADNDLAGLMSGLDQVYDIPHLHVEGKLCRTNLAPRTIMRGPGFLNAVMVAEQVVEHVAAHLGLDGTEVRQRNFWRPEGVGELQAPPTVEPSPTLKPSVQEIAEAPQESAAVPSGDGMQQGVQQAASVLEDKTALAAAVDQGQGSVVCGRFKPGPDGGDIEQNEREMFTLPRVWDGVQRQVDYPARVEAVQEFNRANVWRKRGCAVTPTRFDCAPPPISAGVSVYADGTVLVTHGGIECGQGLSTKVKQMAAYALGQSLPEEQRPFPMDKIQINDTRSDITPNAGPTWSSTTSEGCVAAIEAACAKVVESLRPHMQTGPTGWAAWQASIKKVHPNVGLSPASVMLSAYGFYDGTERDKDGHTRSGAGNGRPLKYTSFGAAYSEVEINMLTGEKTLLRTDLFYDVGRSLNPAVDIGQIEGAFVMGMGLQTSEEVVVDQDSGKLLSDGTWTYKIPSAGCIPRQFNVTFLKDSPNIRSILSSKAIGEPSLMLSSSVLYALRRAVVPFASQRSGRPGSSSVGSSIRGVAAGAEFLILEAPATTAHLKEAIGGFSIADILQEAAGLPFEGAPAEREHSGEWVLVC
eukprot:jgi/Astpho2/8497/Aster-05539